MKIDVKQTVELEEFWMLRGVRDTVIRKEVVAEKEITHYPTEEDVAQFLYDNPKVNYCSVQPNYRLKK